MTNEEALKHLTAKLECLMRSKGFREKCDTYNSCEGCYECDLGYKQGNIGDQIESLKIAIQALKQEPKSGHWQKISADKYSEHAAYYFRCSECGKDIIGEHNYCPNCGAKMTESEVEE